MWLPIVFDIAPCLQIQAGVSGSTGSSVCPSPRSLPALLCQADQWKIYPCAVTPWTLIEKWFNEGTYIPCVHVAAAAVPYWVSVAAG